MVVAYKEIVNVKNEFAADRSDLLDWRMKIQVDLKMFYEKFDLKIKESGFTDEDR